MVFFIILGAVVLITFIVLGILFYTLSKEGQKKDEDKAVPLTDLNQLKKELSSGLLEPQNPQVPKEESEIIPAFVPKVLLPVQEVQSSADEDSYKKRVQEIENELRTVKQKSEEQADVAREMILTLTKENQSLKNQQAEGEGVRQKLTELEAEVTILKAENVSLKIQLESTNATVTEAPKPEPQKPESDEALLALKQKCEDLEYALIKARAQSSGLERVSFNYKNQLEDFLKKVSAAQVTNDHLSQVKNRLEGMVEQVKSQNEELVKKDHLAQFELEKNHSRLVSLEREYESLKARVQQNSQ